MEKRLILAIVLSFLVLFGYQALFVKPQKPLPPQPAPAAGEIAAQVPGAANAAPEQPKTTEAKPVPGAPAPAPATTPTAEAAESEVVVDTTLYRAVCSNKGGVLKSWVLKKHKNSKKENLELVPALAAEIGRFPFSLGLDDAALAGTLNAALFQVSGAGLDLADGANGELRFAYSDGSSVQAEKTFRFTDGSYAFDLEIRVWQNGQPVSPSVLWGPGISNLTAEDLKQSFSASRGSAVYTGGKVIRMNERKFKAGENTYNFVDWAAYEENYFVALFVPPPQKGQAAFLRETVTTAAGPVPAYFIYVTEPRTAFVGPKDSDALKAFGHSAKKVINFGMFGSIAEILLAAVKFFHKLVPNWGAAIILLTIVIKLLFFPLTYSSTKSMAKMAEIQPKIKALRAKYKKSKTDIDQRRQMNVEMMALYKEQGINPAGGCLPLLIQLPVFWGVFRMLVVAVEMRHAPFALWITDLSTKDPYYVTPVLMGITQFISQKMTPSSADPAQAKMMLVMPFVMTIFFINFQSGLVLYWLTTNVLQIGQQALINHMMARQKKDAHGKRK
jgi:YidC/Oxa1 family membrane protein insertase